MNKDAKSFPEIWKELNPNQQYELREAILKKTGATANTFWFWKQGASIPSSGMVRKAVASVVSSYLNIEVSESALFPRKR